MGFFSDLRERRLTQIVVSYVIAGWGVLQVADHFVDRNVVPEFVYQLVLIWYLLGIPAAVLVGWHHGEKGVQKVPRSEIALLSMLLLAAIGLSIFPVSKHLASVRKVAAAESGLEMRRIGVLYFDDVTRGKPQQHLAEGLTEDLIDELKQVRTLDVISKNGVAQFRNRDVDPDSIARSLRAGTLVDGTVEQVGDRLRVDVRLLDGNSGAAIQRASFERPAGNPLAIRDELVQETSRLLRGWLGEEIRLRTAARDTENPRAWALLQRAEKSRKDAEALLRSDDFAGMAQAFQRADSLLVHAETLDPVWAEPTVLRGFIAYRQSRLAHEPHEAVEWLEKGMAHAERVLQRSPRNARALELRGTLRYWRYLLNVTSDPAQQDRLLQQARQDLEEAVRKDPTLASAHSTLSHLYYSEDIASAVLAARKAYEEDAYLDVANEVLWRLFSGSYDLAEFTQARRWCDEGTRRFPQDYRFTECQLWIMTTPAGQPDVPRAWSLLARLDTITPEVRRSHRRVHGQMIVGGVLARAGLPDSARAVLHRARASTTPETDPTQESLLVEAHIRTLLGDNDGAIDLLKRFAATRPGYSFEHHWWWRKLHAHPRFQELATDH